MSLDPTVNDREYQKFRAPAAGTAVAVCNADGSAISAGGGGGTSMTDDAAFTPGGSSVTPIGALADETTPDAVDEGDVGAVRMTLTRALHVNLRDSAGNEVGAGGGTQYAEDTPTSAGEQVTMAGVIRQDARASLVGADGDRTELQVNANGELRVKHDDALAVSDGGGSLTVDDGGGALTVDGTVTVGALPTGASAGQVQGTTAAGAAVANNPVQIAGSDGTNVQRVKTDAQGELQVDVLTLPALAAGTNNIGDVDVLSLPALAAGNNNIGDVDVASLPALASGSNTIGKVGLAPQTSGGLSVYKNLDLDEGGVSVKGSAGQVFGWYLFNAAASARYVKFYDKATAPTVGTDTPLFTVGLPAGAAANVELTNGLACANGIGLGATTGVADNNTGAPGANELVVAVFYK